MNTVVSCFAAILLLSILSGCGFEREKQSNYPDTPQLVDSPVAVDSINKSQCLEKLFDYYNQLSTANNFSLRFYECPDANSETHYWTISIFDKTGQKQDSIKQAAYVLYPTNTDLKDIRSYSTQINTAQQVIDNHYGTFIVTDFNFDHKDDFALLTDMGGNGGALYAYYLQRDDGKFEKSNYLTDTVVYFPSIDKKSKTLTTKVHSGVCGLGEDVYKFQSGNNWKRISHRVIDICK